VNASTLNAGAAQVTINDELTTFEGWVKEATAQRQAYDASHAFTVDLRLSLTRDEARQLMSALAASNLPDKLVSRALQTLDKAALANSCPTPQSPALSLGARVELLRRSGARGYYEIDGELVAV
jgi:hypothetical protein